MTWENSSAQVPADAAGSLVRGRRQDFGHTYALAVWLGTSDVSTDRRILEAFTQHTTPQTAISYESATIAVHEDHEVEAKIDSILRVAADEDFEDGMEGRTSNHLNLFVTEDPIAGVQQLIARLNSKRMNQAVAADIARILGRMKHRRSHDNRVYMAECLLYSESPVARDAGAVALCDLEDGGSVSALQSAIEKESIPALKADMEASLDELMRNADAVRVQEARP